MWLRLTVVVFGQLLIYSSCEKNEDVSELNDAQFSLLVLVLLRFNDEFWDDHEKKKIDFG